MHCKMMEITHLGLPNSQVFALLVCIHIQISSADMYMHIFQLLCA